MRHYLDMTRWISALVVALTLVACDGGGEGMGSGDGGGEPSACEQTAMCMVDECSDELDQYARACGCNPDGTDCLAECDTSYQDALVLCMVGCDADYTDQELEAFRSCAGGTAEQCDDAMLACEAAP